MLQLKPLPASKATSKVDWDDLDALADSPNESATSPYAATSPPTAWLDHREMPMYGAEPLEPRIPIVKCLECEKPMLASALSLHKLNCEKIKNGGLKGKKDTIGLAGSKRKSTEDDIAGGADGGASGPPKKKTKKELAKAAGGGTKRVKGPAHLDKHCCVINEKGQPCSRSITCKVHSMVAKRAVQGRSKFYDELLLDWKRENIPGFVEPVKKETKAERKAKKEAEKEAKRLEMLAAGIVPGKKKSKKAEAAAAAAAAAGDPNAVGTPGATGTPAKPSAKKSRKTDKTASGDKASKKGTKGVGEEDDEEDDYDSEVEFASLVQAVRAARPYTAVPIAQPTNMGNFFIARNETLRNCYDTMSFAFSGGSIRSAVPPASTPVSAVGVTATA